MSDQPRFALLSPNRFLSGLVLDPVPALARGFIEPMLDDVPGCTIDVPNAMEGSIIVENNRAHLEAGVNAPSAGREAGGDRASTGFYAPSTITFGLKIFSQKLPRSPLFAPERQDWWNAPSLDPTVASAGQRQAERIWTGVMAEGCWTQCERSYAEALFGTDLAGTGCEFGFANISADATHNPDGLTADDDLFPIVDILARMVHTLDLSAGGGNQRRYVLTIGEKMAVKLERNKQLLGIQVKQGDATGVAMVNGQIRLTPDGVISALSSRKGIAKVLVGSAVVSLTSGVDASASHSWFWPEGFSLVAMANVGAEVDAVRSDRIRLRSNTGLLRIRRPEAKARIYLPDSAIQFEGHADMYRQHKVVNANLGLSRLNA